MSAETETYEKSWDGRWLVLAWRKPVLAEARGHFDAFEIVRAQNHYQAALLARDLYSLPSDTPLMVVALLGAATEKTLRSVVVDPEVPGPRYYVLGAQIPEARSEDAWLTILRSQFYPAKKPA